MNELKKQIERLRAGVGSATEIANRAMDMYSDGDISADEYFEIVGSIQSFI